jgi:hypothetical protein
MGLVENKYGTQLIRPKGIVSQGISKTTRLTTSAIPSAIQGSHCYLSRIGQIRQSLLKPTILNEVSDLVNVLPNFTSEQNVKPIRF